MSAALDRAVDGPLRSLGLLAPIGLDALVERAALLTRVDRKYLLPVVDADDLVAGLAGTARVLDIDGRRSFGYASQYVDTDDLASYHLAAQGRRRRYKVRSRRYLDSGEQFVEVKTRGARGTTVKERLARPAGEALGPQDRDGRAFVHAVLDRAGFPGSAWALHPTLRTRYRRSTLLLPEQGARVTIDTDLTWSLPDGDAVRVEGLAVVETKGAGVSSVDRLLWRSGHRPTRLSKYATGLAALRPELRANRWHPTLVRQLAGGGAFRSLATPVDHGVAGGVRSPTTT